MVVNSLTYIAQTFSSKKDDQIIEKLYKSGALFFVNNVHMYIFSKFDSFYHFFKKIS